MIQLSSSSFPQSRIYYEDMVSLTYTGTLLKSVNGGQLAAFTSRPIQNTADGYPPNIILASIRKSGSNYRYIDLSFDKPLLDADNEISSFIITLNDVPANIEFIITDNAALSFSIAPYIKYGDVIKISYSGGNVRNIYNGKLQDFSDFQVTNTIPEPLAIYPLNNEASGISVIPNPAQYEIQVSWESLFIQLIVYSIEGMEVLRIGYGTPQLTASVPLGFDSGVYLLLVKNEREWGIKKVILN